MLVNPVQGATAFPFRVGVFAIKPAVLQPSQPAKAKEGWSRKPGTVLP
ncbi:MAG: hypothetical protein IPL27_27900 [Lewinellaceae bacterium]|nr:hypothetical protein [Lewinellaceae bacterium]